MPRKLQVMHTAILQCAEVHDSDDTLEASNPYSFEERLLEEAPS